MRNLTYDTSVVNVNQRQVSLSWKAPQQNDNYQLLLVYFITVTKLEEEATSYHFKVTNTVRSLRERERERRVCMCVCVCVCVCVCAHVHVCDPLLINVTLQQTNIIIGPLDNNATYSCLVSCIVCVTSEIR